MIGYRDMTFCIGNGCLKFDTCPRALTDEVNQHARNLKLPICMFSNPEELDCYTLEIKTETETKIENETD